MRTSRLRSQFLHNSFRIAAMKISAVIITKNEADNIAAAISSVDWADEVLVVDSGSTDGTTEIAAEAGARVITRAWPGFAAQKQFAVDSAENDWIFSLDADERVSAKLKDEVLQLKRQNESDLAKGYRIPRLSTYMGKQIRGGGWYPDWQLRFFDRRYGKWKDVAIHESVEMNPDARVEKLSGDILHHSVTADKVAKYHHKMIGERYAPLAARQMFENGRRTSRFKIYTVGWTTFVHTFFLKGGFRDGFAGFVIARFAAHHAFLKHLMLWEMHNDGDKKA
jgi:glycosyltransferase involved in cell wall biosynthesis